MRKYFKIYPEFNQKVNIEVKLNIIDSNRFVGEFVNGVKQLSELID